MNVVDSYCGEQRHISVIKHLMYRFVRMPESDTFCEMRQQPSTLMTVAGVHASKWNVREIPDVWMCIQKLFVYVGFHSTDHGVKN